MHPNENVNAANAPSGVVTMESKVSGVAVLVCGSGNLGQVQAADRLVVSEMEAERAARLRDPAARQMLLASLASARAMLGRVLEIPPGEVDLARTANGAPFLASCPDRAISISRSQRWTAVALADSGPIGVDIEQVRPIDWQPMLAMICSDEEQAAMRGLAASVPDRAPALFFELWTVKEAVLKASGRGLRAGAKNVPVPVSRLGQGVPAPRDLRLDGAHYTVWSEWLGDAVLSVATGIRT